MNIYILYIIFPILLFLGKPISLYIASTIDKNYVEVFLLIDYFLLYNFIILIAIRFIVNFKEVFNDFWKLIKLIYKTFLSIFIYTPNLSQTNQTQSAQKTKTPKAKRKNKFSKRALNSIGVYTSTNKKIDLYTDNKKRGGEALVYEASDGSLAKVFHSNSINLDYKKDIVTKLQKVRFSDSVVKPIEMIYDEKESFIGYTMEKKEGIELGRILLKKVTDFFPNYTLIDIIDLSISIINAFEEIHKKSIVVGDVNPRNILIQSKSNVFIIDVDSFQIGKPSPAYLEEYRRPKYYGENILSYIRTIRDDSYSITTIIFQLLHFGLLPFGGSDEDSLTNAHYVFNPYYPEKNLLNNKVLNQAHNRLSHDLKKAFNNVFKYDKYVSLSTLKKYLQAYMQMLIKVQNK